VSETVSSIKLTPPLCLITLLVEGKLFEHQRDAFFIEIPNIPLSHQFLKFITALDHLEENNRDLVFFEVS